MFQYNQNKDGFPKFGDIVEICHTNGSMDGLKGKLCGWSDFACYIAIIVLEEPYLDGRTAVTMPVVCLRKLETEPSEGVDEKGFTVWQGNDYRPKELDGKMVVVERRDGVISQCKEAKFFPQIMWLHRHVDDSMSTHDIVAYKVCD